MTTESEPRQFRRGESTGRPIGGNISDKPFPAALYELASSRGYESQLKLAAATHLQQTSVSEWYRGERVPSPENFGTLLVVLKPNDEEHERFVCSYAELIKKGFGGKARAGTEVALRAGRHKRTRSETEIGKWIEDFCDLRGMSLREFFKSLDFVSDAQQRNTFGINKLSQLLQKVPELYGLREEEIAELAEAVAKTIENRLTEGHVYSSKIDTTYIQRDLACVTYNGEQAAKELRVSRERVRQLRVKHNLPLLLTDEDLDMIRQSAVDSPQTKIGRVISENVA